MNDRSCCDLGQIRQKLESGEDVFYLRMTLSCEEAASYHTPVLGGQIIDVALTLGPNMDLVKGFLRVVRGWDFVPVASSRLWTSTNDGSIQTFI